MSTMKANIFKIILGTVVVFGGALLGIVNQMSYKGIKVEKWDNYYNESNIVFFYEDFSSDKIKFLEDTYHLKEATKDEKTDLDKAIKITNNTIPESTKAFKATHLLINIPNGARYIPAIPIPMI